MEENFKYCNKLHELVYSHKFSSFLDNSYIPGIKPCIITSEQQAKQVYKKAINYSKNNYI